MTKEVPRTSVLRDEELSISDATLIARLRVDEPMCEEHFTANRAANRIEALVKEKDQEYKNNIVRMAGQAKDFMEEISTLKTRIEVLSISNATLIAERDHWKDVARREGVCMTCRGPRGAPEPYGCSDCLNTGYCGEHHNTVADLGAKLAKAVEALEYYAVEAMPWDADDSLIARATLAEIKSGVATTPYGLEGESHE